MNGWEMTPQGPQALLDVEGWGAFLVRWQRAGHCTASAESGDDVSKGTVWSKARMWRVSLGFGIESGRAVITSGNRVTAVSTGHGKAKDMPPSYLGNMIGAVIQEINDFNATHPQVLVEAERYFLEEELRRAMSDVTEAEEELGAAEEALFHVEAALAALPPKEAS